jgi:predicted unusual protein kinase regulating ubiquinone biosynthesis (AarF/ABC1/UbiB family)
MADATSAERLKRYAGMARLFYKYGSRDLVARAGLEEALLHDQETAPNVETEADPRAAQLADDLERLGPAYIKLGQLLSTRSDLLPPAYLEALTRLQDRVEPFPFADVEKIVQQELGFRISKGFASFDATPLAAASLGQVHRATLRDGLVVVVKVQRPDARERVVADLAAFAEVADLLDRHTDAGRVASLTEVVEEFRKTILEELDYRREAQNLLTLRENLSSFRRLIVPAPIPDYSSGRVLTMDYIAGTKITALNPVVRVDLDRQALVEQLFQAYLRQIIVDGFFHADPHPGNLIVTDDGRLALIDLGMVSRLSSTRQEQLLKLLLAVAEARGDQAASVALQMGRKLDSFDREGVEREILDLVTRYKDATLQDVQAGAVMMQLSRIAGAHGLRLPSELTLLGKTLLNLDEVARTLAPDFDAAESIRRNASTLMQERMRQSLSIGGAFAALSELRTFVEALPGRLNRVMDAVSTNEFKLKMEVIDEGALIEGFQKIANRISLALVLAALIVGAAMLMQVRTPFTLLGYPGFAMLLFLAAGAGGVWMAVSILTGDRPNRRRS